MSAISTPLPSSSPPPSSSPSSGSSGGRGGNSRSRNGGGSRPSSRPSASSSSVSSSSASSSSAVSSSVSSSPLVSGLSNEQKHQFSLIREVKPEWAEDKAIAFCRQFDFDPQRLQTELANQFEFDRPAHSEDSETWTTIGGGPQGGQTSQGQARKDGGKETNFSSPSSSSSSPTNASRGGARGGRGSGRGGSSTRGGSSPHDGQGRSGFSAGSRGRENRGQSSGNVCLSSSPPPEREAGARSASPAETVEDKKKSGNNKKAASVPPPVSAAAAPQQTHVARKSYAAALDLKKPIVAPVVPAATLKSAMPTGEEAEKASPPVTSPLLSTPEEQLPRSVTPTHEQPKTAAQIVAAGPRKAAVKAVEPVVQAPSEESKVQEEAKSHVHLPVSSSSSPSVSATPALPSSSSSFSSSPADSKVAAGRQVWRKKEKEPVASVSAATSTESPETESLSSLLHSSSLLSSSSSSIPSSVVAPMPVLTSPLSPALQSLLAAEKVSRPIPTSSIPFYASPLPPLPVIHAVVTAPVSVPTVTQTQVQATQAQIEQVQAFLAQSQSLYAGSAVADLLSANDNLILPRHLQQLEQNQGSEVQFGFTGGKPAGPRADGPRAPAQKSVAPSSSSVSSSVAAVPLIAQQVQPLASQQAHNAHNASGLTAFQQSTLRLVSTPLFPGLFKLSLILSFFLFLSFVFCLAFLFVLSCRVDDKDVLSVLLTRSATASFFIFLGCLSDFSASFQILCSLILFSSSYAHCFVLFSLCLSISFFLFLFQLT